MRLPRWEPLEIDRDNWVLVFVEYETDALHEWAFGDEERDE